MPISGDTWENVEISRTSPTSLLDIFWLKDESFEDMENLPDPEILAMDITENLESALDQFRAIYEDLGEDLGSHLKY